MIVDNVFGPWRPDLPDLNNPGLTVAHNAVASAGAIGGSVSFSPLKRATLYSDTSMASRPLGTSVGQDQYANAKVYGGCATKLYKLSPVTRQWTDISRSGGYATIGTDRWNSVEFGSYQIFTNYNNEPQYIDMNVDVQFANLTSLVKGKYTGTHKGFVFLGNTWDPLDGAKPNRVRWSGQELPGDWGFSAQTQADFQDIHGYGAITGLVCNDSVWVLMQHAIVQMTYIGAPYVFRVDTRVEGKGCTVPESVITVEGRTYFLSDDGFYGLQGGGITNIGNDQINKWFLADADPTQYQHMTAVADPRRTLIYWSYVSNAAEDGLPDKMIIYNYQSGLWTTADATVDFLFQGRSLPWTIDQLDIYGSIDNVPASFDDPIWAGGVSLLWGMKINGAIYTFGGTTLPAQIETPEQHLINSIRIIDPTTVGDRTNIMGVRPFFEGYGATASVTVGSRSQSNGTVIWSQPSTTHADTGFAYFRLQDRFHRFRLQLFGEWDKAYSLQIDANSAGSR